MGDSAKTPNVLNRSIYGMMRPQTKPLRLSSLNQSQELDNLEENPNFLVMNTTSKPGRMSTFLLQEP